MFRRFIEFKRTLVSGKAFTVFMVEPESVLTTGVNLALWYVHY